MTEDPKKPPDSGVPTETPSGATAPVEVADSETIPISVGKPLPPSPDAVPAKPQVAGADLAAAAKRAARGKGHGDSEPTVVDPLLTGTPRRESEPKLAGTPKRDSEPNLEGVPNRRLDSEPGLSERLDTMFPSDPGAIGGKPYAPKRSDSEPPGWAPAKPTIATRPFQLPPREAATPDPAPQSSLTTTDESTKPLEIPAREPGPSAPVTVSLVEENTGVLTPPTVKPGDVGTKPFGIPARMPGPSAPVMVALVEENTGVLTPEPMKPVAPPPKPVPPTDKPITMELVEETSGVLSLPEDTGPANPLTTVKPRPAVDAKAVPAVDADDIEESVTTEAASDDKDDNLVDWVAPEDGFMLADEIGDKPVPAPPVVPSPPILPSPQEAALEAARIVSQMVDIESESGAMIAAAAAAGAAIEAAVAAQKATAAIDARASQPGMRIPPEVLGVQTTTGTDPVTTVRLSRDRILAALANEDIAMPVAPSARDSQIRSPAEGRIRARTEPGIDDDAAYEDFDPVAIAAAAIGRLRARARTDLAELRVHYHRHDILVLLLALVIIVVAGRVHQHLITPPNETFSERGLTFEHSSSWLKPEAMPPIAPRLVRDPTGAATKPDPNLYHVEISAVGSNAKLEVLIDKKPTWSNIVTGLDLDRRSRWGELYTLDDSSVKSIAGHDWLRTAYSYAHAEKGDVPRVDHALEYATIDREQIYVVTIYGTPLEIDQIEDVVGPSLRVPSQTGLPLVPQTSRLSQRKYPGPVGRAFDSTVMVVVADLVDGRLQARGGGSGVIVGGEGSILTNYHVIHDKDGRLHDVFVIGRFSTSDRAPQLQCAGRPSRSKLLRELDLALIKCDLDLDGRSWSPTSSSIWATLPEAKASDVKVGQRLWVLGYPDVGGGGLTLNVGEVEGWTGEEGTAGKDFIKTDASITHGNSGGPVIDDQGRLVGIASAFRTKVTASGSVIETAQVGLVRPLQAASALLNYAAAGWTPREGYTDVELTPTAVEAAAEGVRIFTTVLDDANEQPVRDATVMVLKPGVNTSTIDMNRLDDQTIAWGKTNAQGEVRLKQLVPIPGTYTVMVVAPGYEPLIGENELHLDDATPPSFDPWGKIGLRSR